MLKLNDYLISSKSSIDLLVCSSQYSAMTAIRKMKSLTDGFRLDSGLYKREETVTTLEELEAQRG